MINTSVGLNESVSPVLSSQVKVNQIKNPPHQQISPQPLRFRSFDAFYQYYSKNQTYENAYRNSITQTPIHNTTLKDKNETFSNSNKLISEDEKPTFTYTTEDYNIKGRVKRLCEIFQKAREDSNYRVRLEKVISKNKITKSSKSHSNTLSNSRLATFPEPLNSQTAKQSTLFNTDLKGQKDLNNTSQVQIYTKRDPNTRPNTNISPLKFKPELISYGSEDSIFNTDLRVQNSPKNSLDLDKRMESPSPKAGSLLKSTLFVSEGSPKIDEINNVVTRHVSPDTLPLRFDGSETVDSNRNSNNALIDDILNRFMNDPEFCDTFFSKLEALNLSNNNNAMQFSRIIDELQFLVENDSGLTTLTRLDSEEHKKDFEWFFNQPKVFDFNVTDSSDLDDHCSPNREKVDKFEKQDDPPQLDNNSKSIVMTKLKDRSENITHSEENNLVLDDESGSSVLPESLSDLASLKPDDDFNSDLVNQFDWIKIKK